MNAYTILQEQFYANENKIGILNNTALGIEDKIAQNGSLTTITRKITNHGDKEIAFLPSISVKTENIVTEFTESASFHLRHVAHCTDICACNKCLAACTCYDYNPSLI